MQDIFDMIIIGGGPGGYTSALYAARAGFSTLVIEKMSPGGQMALTDTIDNYPGFEEGIDGFTLGMKMQQGAERFGAKIEYAEVVSVDFSINPKKVKTSSKEFLAKTVVLATGADPRELGVEREWDFVGRGVHYCAHCDGRFYKDKTVVVVGGGNTAAEDALYLSRVAKKVYLIHRRDSLKATKIYRDALTKADNVDFVKNKNVIGLVGERNVNGVTIKDSNTGELSEILCDGVFISIGRKPATQFLGESVALDEGGYIIADETTKTNVDGVYAVGDVRTKALRQVVTAVSDGATAVHFAEEYLGQIAL